jgi:pilus assembly protein Flp/PilA
VVRLIAASGEVLLATFRAFIPTLINSGALRDSLLNFRTLPSPHGRGTWRRCMSKVVAFIKDESGATAIEYGLIAAGISVVIIATVNTIGSQLNSNFTSISTQLK